MHIIYTIANHFTKDFLFINLHVNNIQIILNIARFSCLHVTHSISREEYCLLGVDLLLSSGGQLPFEKKQSKHFGIEYLNTLWVFKLLFFQYF